MSRYAYGSFRIVIIFSVWTVACISACSPASNVENAAISPTQGDLKPAPTNRPTQSPRPSDTPIPSATPTLFPTETPEPSPTPAPTPTPSPDPNAIIDWASLELPSSFNSYSPSEIGVGPGEIAYQLEDSGTLYTYEVVNAFYFGNEGSNELIYGYTVHTPSSKDKEYHDWFLMNTNYEIEVQALPFKAIGDVSRAMSGMSSETRRIDIAGFRLGDVGARVFIRYDDGSTPSISIDQLANVYATSLTNPTLGCHLTNLTEIKGSEGPLFEITADGFYPGEKRMISVSGGGINSTLAGLSDDAEVVDEQGKIEGTYGIPIMTGLEIELPIEVEIRIRGHHSGCEITEIVEWPSDAP